MLEDYLKKKIQPVFIEISSDEQFEPTQNLPIVEKEQCKVEDNKSHIEYIVPRISASMQPQQEKDKITTIHVQQETDKITEHVQQETDKTTIEHVQRVTDKTTEHVQQETDKTTHQESNEKDGILQVIVSESENEYAFTFECQMFEEENKPQVQDVERNLNSRKAVERPQACLNPESASISPQTQICSLELRRMLLRTLMASKLGKYTNIQ